MIPEYFLFITSCCARLHDFPGLAYRKKNPSLSVHKAREKKPSLSVHKAREKTHLYVPTKLASWACQLPGYDKCPTQPFPAHSHRWEDHLEFVIGLSRLLE